MPGLSKNLQGGHSELGKECGYRCAQNGGFEWGKTADAGLKALGGLEHERHNLACFTRITRSVVWRRTVKVGGWRKTEM